MARKYSLIPTQYNKSKKKKIKKIISFIFLTGIIGIMIYATVLQKPVSKVNTIQKMSIDSFYLSFPNSLSITFTIAYDKDVLTEFDGDITIDGSTNHTKFSFLNNKYTYTIQYNFSNQIGIGIDVSVKGILKKTYITQTYISSTEDISFAHNLVYESFSSSNYYSEGVTGDIFKITFIKSLQSLIHDYQDNITCIGDIYIDIDQKEIDTGIFENLTLGMNKITQINHTIQYSSHLMQFDVDYLYDTNANEAPDVYGSVIEHRIYAKNSQLIEAPDPEVYFLNFVLYFQNGEIIPLQNMITEIKVI